MFCRCISLRFGNLRTEEDSKDGKIMIENGSHYSELNEVAYKAIRE
jgi:hypothetical protein